MMKNRLSCRRFLNSAILIVVLLLLTGCGRTTLSEKVSPEDRARSIAGKLREAMVEPSIMQLDIGQKADSGLRGVRQREVAKPFMHELVACGLAASEPLEKLIHDEDESVRRSCVILLGISRSNANGVPLPPPSVLELHIPLFLQALDSKDEQVRYYACGCLGDLAFWSDECLESLRQALPALRKLKGDSDSDVRRIAFTACQTILSRLSTNGGDEIIRESAAVELEELKRETGW
jgi:HEAT repeats